MNMKQGTVTLIAGASSGIGRATAVRLAKTDTRLLLLGRNERKCQSLLTDIGSISRKEPELFVGDLSTIKGIKHICGVVLDRTDRLDVLINNAGTVVT